MDIKKAREDLRKGKTIYDMNLRVGYYARISMRVFLVLQ